MACLGQTAAVTASSPYPHYSGFYGYIQPFNDGRTSKILRTDGTLHEAKQQGILASGKIVIILGLLPHQEFRIIDCLGPR